VQCTACKQNFFLNSTNCAKKYNFSFNITPTKNSLFFKVDISSNFLEANASLMVAAIEKNGSFRNLSFSLQNMNETSFYILINDPGSFKNLCTLQFSISSEKFENGSYFAFSKDFLSPKDQECKAFLI